MYLRLWIEFLTILVAVVGSGELSGVVWGNCWVFVLPTFPKEFQKVP